MTGGEPGPHEPHWVTQRPWAVEGHVLYALPERGRLIIVFAKNPEVAAYSLICTTPHSVPPPTRPRRPPGPRQFPRRHQHPRGERPPAGPSGRDPRLGEDRGYQLSERGRIPAHIEQHYHEVHGTGE